MTGQIEPQIESLFSSTFDQCYSITLRKNFAVDFLRLRNLMMCDRLELDWHCAHSTAKYLSNWNRHLYQRVDPTDYLIDWLYYKRGTDYTRYLLIDGPTLCEDDVRDLVATIKQVSWCLVGANAIVIF
jgi:hypothetical protein